MVIVHSYVKLPEGIIHLQMAFSMKAIQLWGVPDLPGSSSLPRRWATAGAWGTMTTAGRWMDSTPCEAWDIVGRWEGVAWGGDKIFLGKL